MSQLPFKARKTKVLEVHLDYLVLTDGKGVAFRKRSETGIWRNLHDFLVLESAQGMDESELTVAMRSHGKHLMSSAPQIHLLSHRKMHLRFHWVRVKNRKAIEHLIWQDMEAWDQLAVPKPIASFLEGMDWAQLRALAKT